MSNRIDSTVEELLARWDQLQREKTLWPERQAQLQAEFDKGLGSLRANNNAGIEKLGWVQVELQLVAAKIAALPLEAGTLEQAIRSTFEQKRRELQTLARKTWEKIRKRKLAELLPVVGQSATWLVDETDEVLQARARSDVTVYEFADPS